jgi:HD-like signal output (HDOD) protein
MSTENALLIVLVEKLKNDTLVLPTLPAIALRVRQASEDPDINLSKMAEVISKDPSLTARMIHIANTVNMTRAKKPPLFTKQSTVLVCGKFVILPPH